MGGNQGKTSSHLVTRIKERSPSLKTTVPSEVAGGLSRKTWPYLLFIYLYMTGLMGSEERCAKVK